MANSKPTRRLTRAAGTGLRDLPSNAAWLLSKALGPVASAGESATKAASSVGEGLTETASSATGSAEAAVGRVQRKARSARLTLTEAVPGLGQDSVASLMRQADAAADEARAEEARALARAQEAKDSADDAERVAREGDQFVRQVRQEAERKSADRVAQAQERFDQARAEAEAESRATIEQAEAEASERTRERRQEAERDQAAAQEAIEEANQALAHARDLAEEAAKRAKDIATQASREAERLSRQAQQRTASIERRTGRVDKARHGAGNLAEAASLDHHQFDALTKDQLLRLAEEVGLESQSATTKQELVEAIIRQGGVPANALTREELLRVGRNTGSDVSTSMTKAELIGAIDAR